MTTLLPSIFGPNKMVSHLDYWNSLLTGLPATTFIQHLSQCSDQSDTLKAGSDYFSLLLKTPGFTSHKSESKILNDILRGLCDLSPLMFCLCLILFPYCSLCSNYSRFLGCAQIHLLHTYLRESVRVNFHF